MKDKHFIDTNIFVYTFDDTAKDKQKKARQIVHHALDTGAGIISYQVVQEFLSVASRKFVRPLTPADCRQYLDQVLLPLCEIFPSADFYRNALMVKEKTGYSYYDSLIVQAAIDGECRKLYSEDLQPGPTRLGPVIVNPFA
jgi:predicted nucleic acid-binding protein